MSPSLIITMIWSNLINWKFTVKINLKWKLHKAALHLTPVKLLVPLCNESQWCWPAFHRSLRMFLVAFQGDSTGCSQWSRYLLTSSCVLCPWCLVQPLWAQGRCGVLQCVADVSLTLGGLHSCYRDIPHSLGVAVFKYSSMSLLTPLSCPRNALESAPLFLLLTGSELTMEEIFVSLSFVRRPEALPL